jgi:hypothetical protein
MCRYVRIVVMVLVWLAIIPTTAYAQASITGVVRDTSGGVLPGVTVEATSPALIERVRTGVTDGTGRYRIEDLRPGAYVVTFTLPGFAVVRREGIQLTGTFVATVNADLRVGTVEETVTVTGETPIVDVQSITRQNVITREMVTALPAGQNQATMVSLLPSVTTNGAGIDSSGIDGEARYSQPGSLAVRGVDEPRTVVGGIPVQSAQGSGTTNVGAIGAYQEIVVDTSGVSVEQKEGGVRINMIPRDGGNTFAGSFYNAFANSSMEGNNLTQELRDQGLPAPNSLKRFWDIYGSLGGPIKRDTLWFHVAPRHNVSKLWVPMFINRNAGNPNAWTPDLDPSQPVSRDYIWSGANMRLTWQATPRNKVAVAMDYSDFCHCPDPDSRRTLEGAVGSYVILVPLNHLFADWTAPVNNRLLFSATFYKALEPGRRPGTNEFFLQDPGPVKLSSVTEQSTGLTYRASTLGTSSHNRRLAAGITLSYVPGAHLFKIGFNVDRAHQDQLRFSIDSPMNFRFRNGVPNQLTMNATPYTNLAKSEEASLFAQDRWTIDRLTLTAGARYDYFHSYFPSITVGPGAFAPDRHIVFPASDGVWRHDISPRAGLVYDLFGNGQTALRVSLNKYLKHLPLSNTGGPFTTAMAPSSRLVASTNRSWNDANRNFVPDCDLVNPIANGECGAMSNSDFGSTRPGLSYDPEVLNGWNIREHNWQFDAGVQHELLPRVSLDVSYFRTWFGNFVVTDDLTVAASDFDQFSITAPRDPRLPSGGGHVISGLHNIKPASFGRPTNNVITFASNYGDQSEVWTGVEVNMTARPQGGLFLQGGASTQRRTTDNCEVLRQLPENDPAGLPYCHVQSAFVTQVKMLGSYTVPKIDVIVSGTFQNVPGPEILANYVATNAIVAPSLGRNLSGGASNLTVNLVEPGAMFGDRITMASLRFSKTVRVRNVRTTASLDLNNVLNSNTPLSVNNVFDDWQAPLQIMNPRFAKVVLQLDF